MNKGKISLINGKRKLFSSLRPSLVKAIKQLMVKIKTQITHSLLGTDLNTK